MPIDSHALRLGMQSRSSASRLITALKQSFKPCVPKLSLGTTCAWFLLRPRMRLAVAVVQLPGRQVRVYLGRREILVAKQLLDAANVSSTIEQMRGEAVPQRVRARSRIQSGKRQ